MSGVLLWVLSSVLFLAAVACAVFSVLLEYVGMGASDLASAVRGTRAGSKGGVVVRAWTDRRTLYRNLKDDPRYTPEHKAEQA